MSHEYHLIACEKMYNDIEKIAKEIEMSLSGTIQMIYRSLIPFFEKNHIMAREWDCQYELIGKKDEKRLHIHIYMQHDLYRKLKLVHQDLNTYSLAQILRKMMHYFIRGYNKYGFTKFMEKLNNIKEIWKSMKAKFMKENKIFKKPNKNKSSRFTFINTTYTDHYCPYIFQFIDRLLQ